MADGKQSAWARYLAASGLVTVKAKLLCNKAIVDHTSPALCTPITPGGEEMVRSAAAWRYLQQTRYNALPIGRNPQNCPFPLGLHHFAGRRRTEPRP